MAGGAKNQAPAPQKGQDKHPNPDQHTDNDNSDLDKSCACCGSCCPSCVGCCGRFEVQALRSWTPIYRLGSTVLILCAMIIVSGGLGGMLLGFNSQVHRLNERYDTVGPFANLSTSDREATQRAAPDAGIPISVSMVVKHTMKAPVYFYYELDAYYENYKRYVRSVDLPQLYGTSNTGGSTCDPARYLGQPEGQSQKQLGPVSPCGLRAWTYFNDTYSMTSTCPSGTGVGTPQPVELDESQITWKPVGESLYGSQLPGNHNTQPALRGGRALNESASQDPHFMLWMRNGANPRAVKLWAVINQDLQKGCVLNIAIDSRYNLYDYNGAKSVTLMTNSRYGGSSLFLGAFFCALAGMSILGLTLVLMLAACHPNGRRKYGDLTRLSWLGGRPAANYH